jgi:DNA processing protein
MHAVAGYNMDDLVYLLACNRIANFGPRSLARCLKVFPDLADLFRATHKQLCALGLDELVATAIRTFDFSTIEPDLKWMMQPNQHILGLGMPEYPALLAEIVDPPLILYAKGQISCLQQPCLGIVGTRNPSVSGSETSHRFAYDLALAGLTIVSGMALGIDAQAHRGALKAEGKTIAVLGTGVDVIYPRRHKDLAAQIAEHGLLLSEFPLQSPPIAHHFPQRNRIISGLSTSVLVVEAALRSGSLITARFAMEQNRDVFAIPGSIYHTQSRGCHHLLQQGACLVTSPEDICAELQLSGAQFTKNISILPEICDNTLFLQHICFELTTIDQIIERSGFSIDEVLCKVVELELQGWIQVVPGGYMRCR